MKLRVKFTLFFTLIFLFLFMAFVFAFSFQSMNILINTVDDKLDFFYQGIRNVFINNKINSAEKLIAFKNDQSNKYKSDNLEKMYFIVYSQDKKILIQSKESQAINLDINIDKLSYNFYSMNYIDKSQTTFDNKKQTMRIKYDILINDNYKFYVVIGLPINDALYSITKMKKQLVFHMIIIFILITLIGILYSKYTLFPFKKITHELECISGDNLSTRVSLKKSDTRNEVGLLTKSINKLLDRLEESFNIEKQFISDVSHESKTPIANLRLIIENVINSNEITDKGVEKLSQAIDTLYSMDFFVKKLLNLYRLEQNQYKFNPTNQNLCDIIDLVYDNLKIIADMKGLNFINQCNNKTILLNCDRDLLYMALSNIVENGLKYTDKGSVIIFVSEKGDSLIITVEDTGIGIQESEIKKIFQRFYRVDFSRGEKQGYGIGLSITDRIIKLHKGKIEIKSIIGGKTRVIITLPK